MPARAENSSDKLRKDCAAAINASDIEITDLKSLVGKQTSLIAGTAKERDFAYAELKDEKDRLPAAFWVAIGVAAGAVGAAFLVK